MMMLRMQNAYKARRFQESEVEKVKGKSKAERHTGKYGHGNDVKGVKL